MVYIGTGRLLGVSDLPIDTPQTMYAIKDQLGSSSYGDPRGDRLFVQQTFTEGTCPNGASTVVCNPGEAVRIASRNPVDLSVQNGWYVDLPTAGERIDTPQTMYAIKDQLGSSSYGDPRGDRLFVQQTFTEGTCPNGASTVVCNPGEAVRIASRNPVDLSVQNGWYVDLPTAGERINTDPLLVLGILLFNTNIPSQSACTLGGYSFRYFLDAKGGGYLPSVSSQVAGQSLGNALATRPVVVQLPSGKLVEVIRMSGGTTATYNLPRSPVDGVTRRASWRELPTDE